MNIITVNCETGEQTERTQTSEEIALVAAAKIQLAAQNEANIARDAAAVAAKESARAKFAALGLTESEINALVGA
jgi:hypothetical protein